MKQDSPTSPHTNLSYARALPRRPAPSMQQLRSTLLHVETHQRRMNTNTNTQPADVSPEAQKKLLSSYLQQALDLSDATESEFDDDDSIGDEQ
jgi:hypothetical protein